MSAPQPGQTLRVLYDFRAEEDGEMTVTTGTLLTIIGEGKTASEARWPPDAFHPLNRLLERRARRLGSC